MLAVLGAFLTITHPNVVITVIVDIGERSLHEPGTWPSASPASPWAIHPTLPPIAGVSHSQMLRRDSRKQLLFSPTPRSHLGSGQTPMEINSGSFICGLQTLPQAGRGREIDISRYR